MQLLEPLSLEQRAFWETNGYLVLPGFYGPAQIAELDAVTDWAWREKPSPVTVDNTRTGERTQMSAVDSDRERNPYKVNDLYLVSETVRRTVLDPGLVPVLTALLGDEPVLCNTLTLDVGTTQGAHVDTLFMTPRSDDALVATWTALEDVRLDCGPLFYYPGSHRLPIFRFSNGSQHVVEAEMGHWQDAVLGELARRGIEREVFLPKAGDVFIWHARLVHGGSPIVDAGGTRKSLVAHFYSRSDCGALRAPLMRGGGAWWLNREQQPAPIAGRVFAAGPGADDWAAPTSNVSGSIDELAVAGTGHRFAADEVVAVPAGGSVSVRGWAFDAVGRACLPELAARVRGRLVRAGLGLPRPDVAAAFADPGAAQAGFSIRLDTEQLERGSHVVAVDARRADGSVARVGDFRLRVG